MLYEFITTYRDAIITRTREKLTARPWPSASANDLENGVPLFLTQLAETLRAEANAVPFAAGAIGVSATHHGRDLLALGFTVSQVVHDYGDICQAVTELAIEQNAPITTEEFHTLNRCLDTAIAEAVTEHARLTAASTSSDEAERLGRVAHEVRDILNTALLAFQTLKRGTVAINGSTGGVLGRSLMNLRDFVDSTLSDVRMTANQQHRERMPLATILNDIATAGGLHADYRGLKFVIEPIDPALMVTVDPQLFGSAVMNLLTNAFKYTRADSTVTLQGLSRPRPRAHRGGRRVRRHFPRARATHSSRSSTGADAIGRGLGLGLSIARKAVAAHGGDVTIRNMPRKGCVFVIELAISADDLPVPPPNRRPEPRVKQVVERRHFVRRQHGG